MVVTWGVYVATQYVRSVSLIAYGSIGYAMVGSHGGVTWRGKTPMPLYRGTLGGLGYRVWGDMGPGGLMGLALLVAHGELHAICLGWAARGGHHMGIGVVSLTPLNMGGSSWDVGNVVPPRARVGARPTLAAGSRVRGGCVRAPWGSSRAGLR